jgi:hypothetical protein
MKTPHKLPRVVAKNLGNTVWQCFWRLFKKFMIPSPSGSHLKCLKWVFPCTTQIALFWPKLLPALFLKKPWYPCPFEILEEALYLFAGGFIVWIPSWWTVIKLAANRLQQHLRTTLTDRRLMSKWYIRRWRRRWFFGSRYRTSTGTRLRAGKKWRYAEWADQTPETISEYKRTLL